MLCHCEEWLQIIAPLDGRPKEMIHILTKKKTHPLNHFCFRSDVPLHIRQFCCRSILTVICRVINPWWLKSPNDQKTFVIIKRRLWDRWYMQHIAYEIQKSIIFAIWHLLMNNIRQRAIIRYPGRTSYCKLKTNMCMSHTTRCSVTLMHWVTIRIYEYN